MPIDPAADGRCGRIPADQNPAFFMAIIARPFAKAICCPLNRPQFGSMRDNSSRTSEQKIWRLSLAVYSAGGLTATGVV